MAPLRLSFFAASLVVLGGSATDGALIVNPPRSIEYTVDVRLILAAEDDGSSVATGFGEGAAREHIEREIDRVWAQAGIDVRFDPVQPIHNSSFALRGEGSGVRSESDFNDVLNEVRDAGLTSPDPRTLTIVLVERVPGLGQLDDRRVAGQAFVGANGIIGFVGDDTLEVSVGLDIVAEVFAHEIGHNLGLDHTADGIANLLSPSGTSAQLNPDQLNRVLLSPFVRAAPEPPALLAGDYNQDGVVDAADYTVWRDSSDEPEPIGSYDEWVANFGATAPAASVPEPAASVLCLAAMVGWRSRRPTLE